MNKNLEQSISSQPSQTKNQQVLKLQKINNLQSAHTHSVYSIALSQNGEKIVSGSEDNSVKIWEVESLQCLQTLLGHTSDVRAVTFSPENNHVASGGSDNTIKVWNIDSSLCIFTLIGHTSRIWSIQYDINGKKIASGSQYGIIKIWQLSSRACVCTFSEHQSYIFTLKFSIDNMRLISGSKDDTIKIWDLNSKKCLTTLKEHTSTVNSVDVSHDGSMLVSGSLDGTIKFWDLVSYECKHTIVSHTPGVNGVAFSSDSKQIVTGHGDDRIRIWCVMSKKCVKIYQSHRNASCVFFLKGDKKIVSSGWEKNIKQWDISSDQMLIFGHSLKITSGKTLVISPQSSEIAISCEDQTIQFIDARNSKILHTMKIDQRNLNFIDHTLKGGEQVLTCNQASMKIWEKTSGKCLDNKLISPLKMSCYDIHKSKKWILVGTTTGQIGIWDLTIKQKVEEKGLSKIWSKISNIFTKKEEISPEEPIWQTQGHFDYVVHVEIFYRKEKVFLLTQDNQNVKIWDFDSKKLLFSNRAFFYEPGAPGLFSTSTISKNGQYCNCINSFGFLEVWNIKTKKKISQREVSDGNFIKEIKGIGYVINQIPQNKQIKIVKPHQSVSRIQEMKIEGIKKWVINCSLNDEYVVFADKSNIVIKLSKIEGLDELS